MTPPDTAFVFGGGGLLGASEVGMVQALVEAGIRPDVVVGTSIGALNGAVVAADPGPACVERLTRTWTTLDARALFPHPLRRLRQIAAAGTHLNPIEPLQELVEQELGPLDIENLMVPFQCCAASIERTVETWFCSGPLARAVAASCAVPGLFPPVRIGDEHFVDGGLVNSLPVGRAVHLGASQIFVLHVGHVEQPLTVPTRPWEVATVAFEIARRHRFATDMAAVPEGVTVHLLPVGEVKTPPTTIRVRDTQRVLHRIEAAYEASADYLRAVQAAR